MSWNILDPRSPLRSKRLQGAVLTIAAVVCQATGINVSEEAGTELVSQVNGILAGVGIIWAQIGALMAKNSPRSF
jgi:acetyl-CoA carboxylase carboxyltransferase component